MPATLRQFSYSADAVDTLLDGEAVLLINPESARNLIKTVAGRFPSDGYRMREATPGEGAGWIVEEAD